VGEGFRLHSETKPKPLKRFKDLPNQECETGVDTEVFAYIFAEKHNKVDNAERVRLMSSLWLFLAAFTASRSAQQFEFRL
jgi:hypothetical protein